MNTNTATTEEAPKKNDWNSNPEEGHGANWRKWLGHLKDKPGASGLEIGTWRGESAEWFLTNIITGRGAHLITVDTFQGSDEHRLAGIDCASNEERARVRLRPFGSRAIVAKDDSHRWLLHWLQLPGSFDFIYIDGAHDAKNVLRDAVLAFEVLKVGGVMIFDDYAWEVMKDLVDRPQPAVDAFLACYAREVEVIGMGWQVAVRRVR